MENDRSMATVVTTRTTMAPTLCTMAAVVSSSVRVIHARFSSVNHGQAKVAAPASRAAEKPN